MPTVYMACVRESLPSYQLFLNANFNGTIFANDYHARLAYATTSCQIMSCKLDPQHPYDTCGCRKWKLCMCGWWKVVAYASHANSHKQQLYCLNWPLQFMVWRYETRDKMDAMQTNEKRKTSNTLPQELLAGITCRGWTSLCKHAQNATDFFSRSHSAGLSEYTSVCYRWIYLTEINCFLALILLLMCFLRSRENCLEY